MNNAICGSPKGVFTPYALNAYPDATAGIHTAWRAGDGLELRVGVFDGGWTEQNTDGWDWTLGNNGTAVAAELQYYFDRAEGGGAQNVIKLGANHHTGATPWRTPCLSTLPLQPRRNRSDSPATPGPAG